VANILVSPEELRGHAAHVQGKASSAQADFAAMKAHLEALSGAFQGQAAQAFQQHWEAWHQSATNLIQSLESLGRFLQNSADTIEETDRSLASGLGQA
jgi:WXG100 family type VII secretion target